VSFSNSETLKGCFDPTIERFVDALTDDAFGGLTDGYDHAT